MSRVQIQIVQTESPWVAHHVFLQVLEAGEARAADEALLEVLHHVAMVSPLVHPETAALRERLPTDRTLVRLLTCGTENQILIIVITWGTNNENIIITYITLTCFILIILVFILQFIQTFQEQQ